MPDDRNQDQRAGGFRKENTMQTNKNKHFTPPKGWTLVRWANQCWKSNPAAQRKETNKQAYIAGLLLQFRGLECATGAQPAPAAPSPE